jgi:two-component system, NtrC family, nitrogen regulation sensor histidine kinase GlnL
VTTTARASPVSGVAAPVPDAASQLASFVFAVILLDPEGRIAGANPATEALLGRSAHRLIGVPFLEVAAIGDTRVEAQLAQADAPLVARDIAITAGAATRRVNLTSSPHHTFPGWRTITLSETGLGEGEAVGDMPLRAPAILAHEIKNPLAAIRGAGQLLTRRLGPRDRPLAALIAGEVDRIAELVDRMQALGSTRNAAPGRCNLHESIRAALASARVASGGAVPLVEAFDPSLPPVVADARVLEQVLLNLLTNAIEACKHGESPRVEVRTRFVSGLVYNIVRLGKATRLPVEIVVSDNGPGVPPELRDHIFEPFVTTKAQGQGLGLALVRKLVRDMGGRVTYDRDERAGVTSFRIALAVAADGAEAAA